MSRTRNSIKNMKYAAIGQFTGLGISFVTRLVFVKTLSSEYLGIEGLFSSILTMLSLAELGVGSAIVYSLYKPISENNQDEIKTLMNLYKKAYIAIGIVVAVIGTALTPILSFLVKDMPDIPNIYIIYIMFVANSSISYFYSYKRSLIIADQKRYITTTYRYIFYFILNIVQIIILLTTKNYILFLTVLILNTFLENYVVSKKAEKLYPYLLDKDIEDLNDETKTTITRNVKAMIYHKVGGIVVSGTDNILMSKFFGIISVGIYSNYLLIMIALNTIINMFFTSITSSIGNLGATESKERLECTFRNLNFFGFWIFAFASICLLNLFNPFIFLWLGNEYLFDKLLVLILVINFYLMGMRRCCLTFRESLGLNWYDRYKALFESIINLIASLILINKIGIYGVFIGTTFSTLTTCFWVEPYVLYKYGFHSKSRDYFIKYAIYTIAMVFAGIITWMICSLIAGNTYADFLLRLIVCAFVPNIIFAVFFHRSEEFKYLQGVLKSLVVKKEN